jgi:uncharacterized membrane protein
MAAEGTVMQPKMVVGVFDDRLDAEAALRALKDAGFAPDQISIVMLQAPRPEAEERHAFHVDETTGVLAGGALGGLAGWLIGATAVAVPGLGALVAAGALVGAVGGAGIGAATGGLIGHFVDQGLAQDEARYYHERIRHGAALLTVRAEGSRADEARTIMHRRGAHDYHTRPTS